jgi:hypothetical protein
MLGQALQRCSPSRQPAQQRWCSRASNAWQRHHPLPVLLQAPARRLLLRLGLALRQAAAPFVWQQAQLRALLQLRLAPGRQLLLRLGLALQQAAGLPVW